MVLRTVAMERELMYTLSPHLGQSHTIHHPVLWAVPPTSPHMYCHTAAVLQTCKIYMTFWHDSTGAPCIPDTAEHSVATGLQPSNQGRSGSLHALD